MGNIKIKTALKHRFGKSINIKGKDFKIDSKGEVEVPEDVVPYALKENFVLVDSTVKFESLEKQAQTEEVNKLLSDAKKQAEQIISNAKREAERILSDAREKAGIILDDARVDEKEEARKALSEKTVKELQEMALIGGITEDKFKNLRKDELIELLVKSSFGEE